MFIQTEATPNPATLKFLPGRSVMNEGTLDIRDAGPAHGPRWRGGCSRSTGVTGVFFGSDFVTVTKGEGEWQHLKPAILGAIMEHFLSGESLLEGESSQQEQSDDEEFFDDKDAPTVATIKELLESRVRPAVAGDGGDITFKGFKDGVVYLTMKGSCSGCPSSTATLKHGIQNLLRHFLPDVREVQSV